MPLKALTVQYEVREFIASYHLPEEYSVAVLKTLEDCQMFLDSYYKTSRSLYDDVLNFREDKIERLTITVEEFVDRCDCELWVEVFESVFMEKFSKEEIEMVEKAVFDKKITLEQLFGNFMGNPNKKILRYVL